MDVLVGVVAAAAGIGTIWKLVARKAKSVESSQGDDLRRRLGMSNVDVSREHVRENAAARAHAKRLAAQTELTALADEGRALLERAEQWKENDERTWRENFADFADRLRAGAHSRLSPATAINVDLECKAVRRASWPAFVSVSETSAGQLSVERGALVHTMGTLLRTFTAGIDAIDAMDAMSQAESPSARAEPVGEQIDALVDDAKQILEEIARNAHLSEYELWSMVHGWRDRMRGVLTQQGAPQAADYIAGAPPSRKLPFAASVTSMVPGQLQPMRQLAGWLERLDAWRRDGATAPQR